VQIDSLVSLVSFQWSLVLNVQAKLCDLQVPTAWKSPCQQTQGAQKPGVQD